MQWHRYWYINYCQHQCRNERIVKKGDHMKKIIIGIFTIATTVSAMEEIAKLSTEDIEHIAPQEGTHINKIRPYLQRDLTANEEAYVKRVVSKFKGYPDREKAYIEKLSKKITPQINTLRDQQKIAQKALADTQALLAKSGDTTSEAFKGLQADVQTYREQIQSLDGQVSALKAEADLNVARFRMTELSSLRQEMYSLGDKENLLLKHTIAKNTVSETDIIKAITETQKLIDQSKSKLDMWTRFVNKLKWILKDRRKPYVASMPKF